MRGLFNFLDDDIKVLYILVAFCFFCIFWMADFNINGIHARLDEIDDGVRNIPDRIDLLSEIEEQNVRMDVRKNSRDIY